MRKEQRMRSVNCLAPLVLALLPTMVLAQDHFFNSNAARIRYVDQGQGEPVFLIHGYTGSIEIHWIDTGVLPNLAKDHRVIALDLRGHGKSDKPHDAKSYGAELGEDVVRLLDRLKIPRAHIVGYSLGANITAKLLTTNPERFITATLGGGAGFRRWTDEDAQAAAAALEGDVPYRSLVLGSVPPDQPKPSEEEIRAASQTIAERNDPLAHAAMARAHRQLLVSGARLAAVRVPTLAIVGSADPALTRVNELKTVWPRLNVVVVEGAVHFSADGRSTPRRPEFVTAIREFVDSHKMASSRRQQPNIGLQPTAAVK
jgi:pimeloyl-ACP methyl ester carboxylesterase